MRDREKYNAYRREWRKRNHDKVKAQKERQHAAALRWRQQNKGHLRERMLISLYGLSQAAYNNILVQQKGVCAICLQAPNGKVLCVDHDHETGNVRGLLCENCNRALGMMKDDSMRLRAAADYLEKKWHH